MPYQKRTIRNLKCNHCGNDFTASRFDAKFCSRSCAVLNKREQKRIESQSTQLNTDSILFQEVSFDLSSMDKNQCSRLANRLNISGSRKFKDELKKIYARISEIEKIEKQEKLKESILTPTPPTPRKPRSGSK